MKWVSLIVTLMVCALAVYYLFYGAKPKPGTPHATVQAYIDAAKKNDEAAIRSLCTGTAAEDAVRIAPQVRKMMAGDVPLGLQPMKADPPRKGFCATSLGRVLGVQLIQKGGQWKIIEVGMSGE